MRGMRGYTLVELATVVAIVGIAMALAAPRLTGWLDAQRAEAAMRRFVGDVHRARILAVRRGMGVTVELLPSAACPYGGTGDHVGGGWRTVADDGAVLGRVDLAAGGPDVCLWTNQSAALGFDSRGLLRPFSNRTVETRRGSASARVAISVLGRVRRLE